MDETLFKNHKLSKLELVWLGVLFWAVALTALEAPYSFTFKTNLQHWQLYSDIIISFIFIADLIYQFNKKGINYIRLKEGTFGQKIKHGFFVLSELISCIPFDLVFFFYQSNQFSTYLKLIRLFRLVRVVKLFSLLGTITIIPKFIRMQIIIVTALIAIHWISCGWILLQPIPTEDFVTHYNKAFYWAVTTLTTIGYGDITPKSNFARLYTMVIMLLGVGVYGLIIGNISRVFADSARHKEKTREKITDLSLFMKHYHIPDRLQGSVFGYYQHMLSKRLSDNDNQIISELPQALKDELQIYMNMKLIRSLAVFKNVTQTCLKKVAGALEMRSFAPGQSVIRIGEMGDEMYIISHGKLEVISSEGKIIATIGEGQFFGEIALLEERSRNADVRAVTYCDLYKLSKKDFIEIIKSHEDLLLSVKRLTARRNADPKIKKAS